MSLGADNNTKMIILFKSLIMKRKKIVKISFGLLITISVISNCRNESKSEQIIAQEPLTLKGQKMELTETFSPIDLELVDSMLIILCEGDENKFHVYNKNTLELIGKFGRDGRGPFEFRSPKFLSRKFKIGDSTYMAIYDATLKRIYYINILSATNNGQNHTISINARGRKLSQLSLVHSAVLSGDSLIIGYSSDTYIEGRFFCYDIVNDKLTWKPFYPQPEKPPHKLLRNQIYFSYLALRPDGKYIAAAAKYFERLDILDKTGKLIRPVIFDNNDIQDFSDPASSPPRGAHQYFTSVSVSENFIYALNIDFVFGPRVKTDTVTLIKVAWDDTLKKPEIFKMTPGASKIEVDEENRRIIGLIPFVSALYIYSMDKLEKL